MLAHHSMTVYSKARQDHDIIPIINSSSWMVYHLWLNYHEKAKKYKRKALVNQENWVVMTRADYSKLYWTLFMELLY